MLTEKSSYYRIPSRVTNNTGPAMETERKRVVSNFYDLYSGDASSPFATILECQVVQHATALCFKVQINSSNCNSEDCTSKQRRVQKHVRLLTRNTLHKSISNDALSKKEY
jgi:hypothetical protein